MPFRETFLHNGTCTRGTNKSTDSVTIFHLYRHQKILEFLIRPKYRSHTLANISQSTTATYPRSRSSSENNIHKNNIIAITTCIKFLVNLMYRCCKTSIKWFSWGLSNIVVYYLGTARGFWMNSIFCWVCIRFLERTFSRIRLHSGSSSVCT